MLIGKLRVKRKHGARFARYQNYIHAQLKYGDLQFSPFPSALTAELHLNKAQRKRLSELEANSRKLQIPNSDRSMDDFN